MADLFKIMKDYRNNLERLHRDSVTDLDNQVISGTPIDQGRARAGWSAAAPPKIGKIYKMTNNVEYIIPLEYGHSQQAPQGMVRVAARNWPNTVRRNL